MLNVDGWTDGRTNVRTNVRTDGNLHAYVFLLKQVRQKRVKMTLLIEKIRKMLLVTMTPVIMQEEYFAFRYFNPQLPRKKKQKYTLNKAFLKPLKEFFLPKKMFMVPWQRRNYNGNEPLVHEHDCFT